MRHRFATMPVRRHRGLLLIALFCVGLLLPAGQASARKLGNSGTSTSFIATVADGPGGAKSQLKIDGKDPYTFDSSNQVTMAGTVNNTTGSTSIPASGIHFPTFQVDSPAGTKTVHINPVGTVTGTINPLTGSIVLNNFKVWIQIDDLGDCHIGSSSDPIVVDPLTTGTSGSGSSQVTGTPYDASNGQAKVVNGTFSVPGAQGCSYFGVSVNGQVNDAVGIPSPSGNNWVQFYADFSPTLTKGVNASFTTTPSSGEIPYTVNVDASASTRTCSPNACQFRWDWDNNGTTDNTTSTPTTSHQYTSVGTQTIKLTVVDTDGDTDSTTRTVTALPHPPDLAISKTHTGNFLATSNGIYTIGVSNVGAGPTQNATTVTDTLPTGLSFVSGTGSGWTCGATGQVVTCTRPATSPIAAGGSAPDITLTVAVAASAPASLTNSASVASSSNPVDPNSANNSTTDPTTVDRVDLRIQKSHAHDFNTGAVESYNLAVDNQGTAATTGTTTVSDTLPGGITYQGFSAPAGWSCSAAGQVVTCTNPNPIAPAQSDSIEIDVVAGGIAVPSVTNTATVSTPNDSNAANDSSSDPTTVIATVDLTIDKAHTSAFRVGSTASWTIAVQNRGARPSAGTTTVHDTIPDGVIPSDASGTGWDCTVTGQDVDCTRDASLGAAESAGLITVNVSVTSSAQRPTVTNTATVSTAGTGDDADANPDNDTDSDPTTITATDLTIDKSHLGGFPLGGQGTYTLTVSNVGTAPTVGTTTVTDTLPDDLTYVSATGSGWSCDASGQDVSCTRSGSIGAGATAPAISLVVAVANNQDIETTNSASVSTADDINPANDSDTDLTPLTAADLQIIKSHSGDFRVGSSRAYLIKVSNVGSQPTTGTSTVTDTLPAGLTYVAATGSGWSCDASGQDVTCTRTAGVASGANAPTITVQVSVATAAYPAVTNVAHVSNHDDRNDANDFASDPTTITGPDLAVDKSHLGSLRANDRATYLIAVDNQGTADTNAPTSVTDTLPAGLSFAGSPSEDWDCSSTGQQVTCEHPGSIAAGQGAETLELRADVDASVASSVTNTATVSLPDDVNSANNSDDDTASVGRVDLAIDKSHDGDLPRGATGTYTIQVTNQGTVSTDSPTHVTDVLPAKLTYVSASGSGWSCSVSSGTVDCLHGGTIDAAAAAGAITLQVDVATDAPAQLTNTASVSNSLDANAANDSDSDPADVTPGHDAAISIHPTGTFRVGTDGNYKVTVRNAGTGALAGPVTVTVTLPDGLSYSNASGPGFTCGAVGPQVTCTAVASMAADARSDISLDVGVAKDAVPAVTTTAQVSAPDDSVASNDSASAPTTVTMIDLAIALQHTGSFALSTASTFVINVENVGSATTIAPTRILDELPAGLSFNSGTGQGWTCASSGQAVLCTHDAVLAPSEQAAPLTLSVTPQTSAAGQQLNNQASVQTQDDAVTNNNSAIDTVTIGAAPPAPAGQVAGQTGSGGTATKCKKKPKKSAAAAKKKCGKKKKKK